MYKRQCSSAQEKEMQKGKMFEEDLQIVEERREMKGKGEKERDSV